MHGGIECFCTNSNDQIYPVVSYLFAWLASSCFFIMISNGGDGAIRHAGLFFKYLQTQQASAVNDTENNDFRGINAENCSIMTINDMMVFKT